MNTITIITISIILVVIIVFITMFFRTILRQRKRERLIQIGKAMQLNKGLTFKLKKTGETLTVIDKTTLQNKIILLCENENGEWSTHYHNEIA